VGRSTSQPHVQHGGNPDLPEGIRENPDNGAMKTVSVTNPLVSTSARVALSAGRVRPAVRIRRLKPRHAPAMLTHLLALPERDRYLRFGYLPTDEQIERFVATLNHSESTLFGVFDEQLTLVGLAQLSYIAEHQQAQTAEFGVSVAAAARGLGLGRALFQRCIAHARNQGVRHLIVYALSENARMLHMARRAGATVERDGGESLARITLPPPTFKALVLTQLLDRMARVDYHVKRLWRALGILSA
jgi:RimJ/RimL family protein N-acetyltransferase